jgi:hypothetical protein
MRYLQNGSETEGRLLVSHYEEHDTLWTALIKAKAMTACVKALDEPWHRRSAALAAMQSILRQHDETLKITPP